MGAIHIENVDERVLRSLRLRARVNRRSFEDEVKALLEEAARPRMSAEEFIAEARRIQAMTPEGVEQPDSTDLIREIRDTRHAGS